MWKLLDKVEAEELWDKALVKFPDYTLFQTLVWGEYKRDFGWLPYRWVAYNGNGEVCAMMQGLLRRYPLDIGVVWAPGGPVGDISLFDKSFHETILQSIGVKRLYCRFFSNYRRQISDEMVLKSYRWTKAIFPINSGLSMRLIVKDDVQMLREFSKNWRHNLRRSEKYNLTITQWGNPNIDEILSIYASMQEFKNLKQQYSRQELEKIFDKLGDAIVMYRCEDHGELIGLRGCAVIGSKAWDLFAATSLKGRKMYASYALFWALIKHCRESGVQFYDMGGINPLYNRGVYDFKKGTGAVSVEYLGEWDWATSGWLRWVLNLAIWRKRSYL